MSPGEGATAKSGEIRGQTDRDSRAAGLECRMLIAECRMQKDEKGKMSAADDADGADDVD